MPLPADRLSPVEPVTGDGPLRLLGVGRLVPEKGFADLVSAVALLDRAAGLTVLGDGPQRDGLMARARALDVDLDLPGRVPPAALHDAYAHADIVVQPSHREGLGLVAAEALLAGVPVVATDAGGPRDLLPPTELVAPGDVRALATRIAEVAQDLDAARRQAAEHARSIRDRLSPEASAERTLTGYHAFSCEPSEPRP